MSSRRPSAALVVAVLALFVAMSGTGYALSLPRHSVGTAQLKKNAVTGAKVKDGSLTSADFVGTTGVVPPSGAYFDHVDGPVVVGGTAVTVASINLPAGGYALEGSMNAQNTSATGAQLYCRVGIGAATRSTTQARTLFLQSSTVDGSSTLPLTDTFVLNLADPGPVQLSCILDVPVGSVQTINAYDINLVAYGGTVH